MIRTTIAQLAGLLLALAIPTSACAKFAITIGNLDLTPGGSGTLRVSIASSDGSPIALDSFAFQLRITPASGTQTQLAFTPMQPQPYTDSSYVFYQDSANHDDDPANPSTLGNVSTTVTPFDTYTGSDSTNNMDTRTMTTSKLLLDVRVTTKRPCRRWSGTCS